MNEKIEYAMIFVILITITTYYLRKSMKNPKKTLFKDILLAEDVFSLIKILPIILFILFMVFLSEISKSKKLNKKVLSITNNHHYG